MVACGVECRAFGPSDPGFFHALWFHNTYMFLVPLVGGFLYEIVRPLLGADRLPASTNLRTCSVVVFVPQ